VRSGRIWVHISHFNRNQSERVLKFPCPSQLCRRDGLLIGRCCCVWIFMRLLVDVRPALVPHCRRERESGVNSSKTKPPITQSICSSLAHARGKDAFPRCINLSAGAILSYLISSWLRAAIRQDSEDKCLNSCVHPFWNSYHLQFSRPAGKILTTCIIFWECVYAIVLRCVCTSIVILQSAHNQTRNLYKLRPLKYCLPKRLPQILPTNQIFLTDVNII
jgi:hypothetical protein